MTAKAAEVTGIQATRIEECAAGIADMIAAAGPTLKLASAPHAASVSLAPNKQHSLATAHKTVICNPSLHHLSSAPETPTDVQDVLF